MKNLGGLRGTKEAGPHGAMGVTSEGILAWAVPQNVTDADWVDSWCHPCVANSRWVCRASEGARLINHVTFKT